MTSLTGASGEDFASILRSLGYRMDRKPKPAEPAKAEPADTKAAEAVPAEPAPVEAEVASVDAPATETVEAPVEAVTEPAASISLLPTVEVVSTIADAAEAPAPLAGDGAVAPEAVAEAAKPDDAAGEPETIEVWRARAVIPNARPNNRPRRTPRAQRAATPATGDSTASARRRRRAGWRTQEGPPRHQRRTETRRQQAHGTSAPKAFEPRRLRAPRPAGAAYPASKPAFKPGFKPNQPGGGRPGQPGGRPGQRGDFGGRPRRDRGDQVERAERERYYAKPHGSGSGARDKAPDPNSPFAKLAALKQALEGNKES